jgi:holo-[acyl-carrier protein] synthase
VRIGTDLVHVPRLQAQVADLGAAFLDRVFTAAEQRECAGRMDRLAGRWAAKEAVIKAFGWRLADVDLRGIEVTGQGRPEIVLHGRADTVLDVSLSHEGEYAIAVVLVSD